MCLFFRLEIPTGVAFSLVLDSVCSDTHRQSWERSINSRALSVPNHTDGHQNGHLPSLTLPRPPQRQQARQRQWKAPYYHGTRSLPASSPSTSSWRGAFSEKGKNSRSKTNGCRQSPQSLQRLKQSELDKLIQEKTIAHIGNVIEFIQQLTIVYLDYGHCVPAFEAVEEALNQNLGIQPYLNHFG